MIRLSDYLKNEYGEKIYKLSLSSGCTCPNRDGTAGYGGCAFCSEGGSGDFVPGNKKAAGSERTKSILQSDRNDSEIAETKHEPSLLSDQNTDEVALTVIPINVQIERAKALIHGKTDAKRFIGYFQSFTNTYGDVDRLKELYMETISRDDIAILSLGTRPDCLEAEVIEMLAELNRIKPVWVELGLQTTKEETAEAMNRCHDLETFRRGYEALKEVGITVIVHVIFGFPGESREEMLETVRYLADLPRPPDGIKIQMLNVLEGTELGRRYKEEPFPLLSMEEYGDLLAEALTILPEDIVLHRMTGDGPKKILIAPEWVKNKRAVLNYLNKRLGTYSAMGKDYIF